MPKAEPSHFLDHIKTPYNEVYRIARFAKGGNTPGKDAQLFHDSAGFRTPLDQTNDAKSN